MRLVGVIIGELLISKMGIYYLIMYDSQVFNINLVITSVFVLAIISSILYYIINYFEKNKTVENIHSFFTIVLFLETY